MQNVITFFKESWAELKQVAWLTVPQMIASTWMVILLVIVVGLYVFALDGVLKQMFSLLL